MRKTISILLTLSIMAQGMVSLALCAYYEVNKKEITEKLCINKNKPVMHCHGQCYLGKQLKKTEENEKRQSQSLRAKDEVIYLYDQLKGVSYFPDFSFVSFIGPYYDGCTVAMPHWVPDQPPQV